MNAARATFDATAMQGVMSSLAAHRPLFHSEADFQHALAWQLHLRHPEARVRLETPPLHGRPVFLDVAAAIGGARVGF